MAGIVYHTKFLNDEKGIKFHNTISIRAIVSFLSNA